MRDASKRRNTSRPLLHRRHIIAKVYTNVVFINNLVNTSPPPLQQQRPQGWTCVLWQYYCKTPRHRRIRLHRQQTGITFSESPYNRAHGPGKTVVSSVGFLQSWQNWWTHLRSRPLTSARRPPTVPLMVQNVGLDGTSTRCKTSKKTRLQPRHKNRAIFCAFGIAASTTTTSTTSTTTISTTATSWSATSTSTSRTKSTATHRQQLQSKRPRRHLRPRHSRCDCGREERRYREGTRRGRGTAGTALGDGPEIRKRRKREPSNPVASVRFTPATTEGGC